MLWGWLETRPTARMVVRGIDTSAFLEACRALLCQQKLGRKYRDAKIQWVDILARQGSPWAVWLLNRGKGGRGSWGNVAFEVVSQLPSEHIPGLREHVGRQVVLLAVREMAPGITDFVVSVEQHVEGSTQRTFAAQILQAITRDLGPQGVVFEQLRAVRDKDLEESCPAHPVTRMWLSREAKKEVKARKKRDGWR